jgi:hypothetical protein
MSYELRMFLSSYDMVMVVGLVFHGFPRGYKK